MTPGWRTGAAAGIAAWILLTAACGQEAGPPGDAAPGVEAALPPESVGPGPAAEPALTRPNLDAMQPDVAALVAEGWQRLQTALAAKDALPADLAEAYADFGLLCYGNGLTTCAERAFAGAARLAPDDARWAYFLALLAESRGALTEAAGYFQKTLALRPGDAAALLRLGGVRFEQARMADARALYQRVLEADPDSAAALAGLGRVASAQGNDGKAVEYLEAALAKQPQASRLNYLLGLAWRNLGDLEKAEAYLQARGPVEPGFPDPLFDAVSAGQTHIGGLWANLNLGSQAFVDGDYETAMEKFRLATADHPDDPRPWQSLGMALQKVGDLEGAVAAYEQALALGEANASAHQSLARVLLRLDRGAEAEAHLRRAVALDPGRIAAHRVLAQHLFDEGRFREALERCEAVLALDPLDVSTGLLRVLALARTDRADEALEEAARLLPLAGEDATRAEVFHTRAHVYLQKGDGARAIRAFESALEADPGHRAARLNLARTLVRARRFGEAMDAYQAVIDRWPDDEATRLEAAGGAILLGRAGLAQTLMEPAAVRETASPRMLSSFARLLALAPDPAVRDPQRALAFARRGYSKEPAPQYAETVALCLAANGRFDEAVALQERLHAEAQGDAARRNRLARNLERYRARSLGTLPLDAT